MPCATTGRTRAQTTYFVDSSRASHHISLDSLCTPNVHPPHNAIMMSDDSSELSSAPSDLESDIEPPKKEGILKFFSKASAKKAAPAIEDSPPPPPREPSPPHEYVLADNPDIAVSFQSLCRVQALISRVNSRSLVHHMLTIDYSSLSCFVRDLMKPSRNHCQTLVHRSLNGALSIRYQEKM